MKGRWDVVDAYAEHPDQINLSPYAYVGNNPIIRTDPDGNCPPCDVPRSESDITGNDMTVTENIFYDMQDKVTSGVMTLANMAVSLEGGRMQEASFSYSGGHRNLTYSTLNSTTDKALAAGNALLQIAALYPTEGPAASIFAKTQGVKTSVVEVVKDVVNANSKASKLENTLYRLETKSGEYLKTGVTSKAIPEKRYTVGFMKDKVMRKLDKGSRANMLKKEREIVEKKPGPLNKEPWAGSKAN